MSLWNYIHGTLGMHMYELFAVAFLAAMLALAVVHKLKEMTAEKNDNTAPDETGAADKEERGE